MSETRLDGLLARDEPSVREAVDRTGILYGYAGAIDGILGRLDAELGADFDVIATGGLSQRIVPFTERIDEVDDLLTLTGLRLIYELNAS